MTSYIDVEARLEAQKLFYREKHMREWLAEIEAWPDPGYCYFIGGIEGGIKIGNSRNPGRRLSEIRRQTPEKLQILARVGGGAGRERYYHKLFAEHHRGGEWFERHPDILAEIERLKA
jgi:hypothetical protein